MDGTGKNVCLRIYVGEDKRHRDKPLYEAIVLKARQARLAGATVVRGTLGCGRSIRLPTTGLLFPEVPPVIVEIVDSEDRIMNFVLAGLGEIDLVTCNEVRVLPCPAIPA